MIKGMENGKLESRARVKGTLIFFFFGLVDDLMMFLQRMEEACLQGLSVQN